MSNLKDKMFEAGIVGAGGAGFPTHVKMNGIIETLIVNGSECEPLLQVDKNIMKHYASELMESLHYSMQALEVKNGVICIKDKYQEVIKVLEKSSQIYEGINIHPLPDVYPVGDEVVLIKEVTGKVLKKGELPIQHDIMVINVETLLNIYKKVFYNLNVTHSYVTIIGEVNHEGTYNIPIGMSISQILETLTPVKIEDYKIIIGGPMTGTLAEKQDVVKKTTKAIIILKKDHPLVRNKEDVNMKHLSRIMASCSQCRACTDMCPRHLLGHQVEPHKLMNAMANGIVDNAAVLKTALGCSNCGVCELYACHHDLSPRKMMMKVKQEFAKNGVRPSGEDCIDVHKDRDYRRVPTNRLIVHLGLSKYDKRVLFYEEPIDTKSVKISLNQHIGIPAQPCVAIGEKILRNQLIARGSLEKLSTNIHASIDGVVKEITTTYITIERT